MTPGFTYGQINRGMVEHPARMTPARQQQQGPLEVLNRLKEQAKAEWISCDRGTEDSFAYIIDVLFPLAEMQMVHTSPTAPEPIPLCPRFGYVDCCPTKEQCPALHYCAEHYRRVDKLLIERDEAAKAARERVLDAIDEWINSDDHLSLYKWEVREKIRSLRTQPEPQQEIPSSRKE